MRVVCSRVCTPHALGMLPGRRNLKGNVGAPKAALPASHNARSQSPWSHIPPHQAVGTLSFLSLTSTKIQRLK